MLHELERPLPTPCTGSADLATRAPKGGGRRSSHTQQTPPRECHRSLPPELAAPGVTDPALKRLLFQTATAQGGIASKASESRVPPGLLPLHPSLCPHLTSGHQGAACPATCPRWWPSEWSPQRGTCAIFSDRTQCAVPAPSKESCWLLGQAGDRSPRGVRRHCGGPLTALGGDGAAALAINSAPAAAGAGGGSEGLQLLPG